MRVNGHWTPKDGKIVDEDVVVDGDLNADGNLTIRGNLTVGGMIICGGRLKVTKRITARDIFDVKGNIEAESVICVQGIYSHKKIVVSNILSGNLIKGELGIIAKYIVTPTAVETYGVIKTKIIYAQEIFAPRGILAKNINCTGGFDVASVLEWMEKGSEL